MALVFVYVCDYILPLHTTLFQGDQVIVWIISVLSAIVHKISNFKN